MYRSVSYQSSPRQVYVAPVDQYMRSVKTYTLPPAVAEDLYTFPTPYEVSRMTPLENYDTAQPSKMVSMRMAVDTDGSAFHGLYGSSQPFN